MNVYVLYEEYEGCNAKILGLFNDEIKLKSVIDELGEKTLNDILAVEPEESGIDWDYMTDKEKEALKQECKDMFKYALITEFNVIQEEE